MSERMRHAWLGWGAAFALISLGGCSLTDAVPDDDAGDVAWMLEALPAVLGRPLRGQDEWRALQMLLDEVDRTALVEAATRDESYLDYWTEVMIDVLRVDRDGSFAAESACYTEAELDASYYPALVEHLRTNAPDDTLRATDWCGTVDPCPSFTMRDVIRASLEQDRLDAMMVAYLIPFNAHLQVSSGRDQTLRTRFLSTMLDRDVDCMACHTSVYSVTDALGPYGSGEWDRFEAAYRGTDGETIDLEGTALTVIHEDGVSFQYGAVGETNHRLEGFFRDDQLVPDDGVPTFDPWGMSRACSSLADEVGGYQASGSGVALGGGAYDVPHTGIAGQQVDTDRDLMDLVAVFQLGMDQISTFGLSVPTEPSASDVWVETYATGWRSRGPIYFEQCATCHTDRNALMSLLMSRPSHLMEELLTSGAGDMPSLCQLQHQGGTDGEVLFPHTVGSGQALDGTCHDDAVGADAWASPRQVAYALRLYATEVSDALAAPSSWSYSDFDTRTTYVVTDSGEQYPVGTDAGHSWVQADEEGTRSGAVAMMLANTVVNRVVEELVGEALVLEHGFPRNELQARALEELAGVFVMSDWSMRALLGSVLVDSRMAGRIAPDRTSLEPYVLPAVVNPWSAPDPAISYADDPFCEVVAELQAANCAGCHHSYGQPETASEWHTALLGVDGLVVPGEPESSELVSMIRNPDTSVDDMNTALASVSVVAVRRWIDAGAEEAAIDCDSGLPRSALGNDRGDLIHARSMPQLQQFVHEVLGWPAPKAFGSPVAGVTWPLDVTRQDSMGRYTTSMQPGRKQLAVDTMVAWNDVVGTCTKPEGVRRGDLPDALLDSSVLGEDDDTVLTPSQWQDWIDVWADHLEALDDAGESVTYRDAFRPLRERILGHGAMVPGESEALTSMVGRPLSGQVWSTARPSVFTPQRLRRQLRNYCGALMTSPQVMLQGMAPPPLVSTVTILGSDPLCFLDEPCNQAAHEASWSDALEEVGYEMSSGWAPFDPFLP